MMNQNYYPKNPTSVPRGLMTLPSSYKNKAIFAILAIILFFILYFLMIVGLGLILKWAVLYPMVTINKFTILLKIGLIGGSLMLFVFSFKFLFKLRNIKPNNRIKIDPKENSELVSFINKVCRDTNAPKPKSIYLDPDVNAYVSYTNTWLSLFFPTKKELTIGLGLVSCLNLSEFKAVIAHEFGHFAQKSMKIGSYIMSANTIIHDMIYSRDKWDETLDDWRASDIRIAFAAWIITPVIWLIRQVLALFYKFLNIMYSSLSREMEFNADKVAVSVSGSDAIISALWKLDNGFSTYNGTLNHLFNASKKDFFVKNLYIHNNKAITTQSGDLEEERQGLDKHKYGGVSYFSTSENSKVGMYASHPPNDLRQENAKFPYVQCQEDTSSPWILFSDPISVQEALTKIVYNQYFNLKPKEYVENDVLDQFINNETEGVKLLLEYKNTFEARYLEVPPEEEFVNSGHSISKQELLSGLNGYNRPLENIDQALGDISSIMNGESKLKEIIYEEKKYKKKDLETLYHKLISKRINYLNEGYKEWDKKFCGFAMTQAINRNNQNELLQYLNQHRSIVSIFKIIANTNSKIYSDLENLQAKGNASELEVKRLSFDIKKSFENLNTELDKIDDWDFYPLINIEDKAELIKLLRPKGKLYIPRANVFQHDQFNKMMDDLGELIGHFQRLDQLNIMKILTLIK